MPVEVRLIPSDLLDLREAQTLDVFLGERVDAVALRLGLGVFCATLGAGEEAAVFARFVRG